MSPLNLPEELIQHVAISKLNESCVDDDGGGSGSLISGGTIIAFKNNDGTLIDISDKDIIIEETTLDEVGLTIVGNTAFIQHKKIIFASHFNTTDGNTVGTAAGPTTTTRFIAGGTSLGDWTAGSQHPATNQDAIIDHQDLIAFEDGTSTVRVDVLGADGSTVLTTFTTPAITTNGVHASGGITVEISEFQQDETRSKGRIDVTLDHDAASVSGRLQVKVSHVQTSGTYAYTSPAYFFDAEPQTFVISGVAIDESVVSSSKWMSGVRYYDIGDSFDLQVGDIDFANSETYPSVQLRFDAFTDYGIDQALIDITSSDLTGWTNDKDDINSSFSSIRSIDQSTFRFIGTDANVRAQPIDWINGSFVSSPLASVAIDTFIDDANRFAENFRGESFRLDSTISGSFDSTASLSSADLFQQDGGISRQPTQSWSSFSPSGSNDTSANSVTQFYYRKMSTSGIEKQQGTFTVSGITNAEVESGDIRIEISPDNIVFFDMNIDFVGGRLDDGDGCRVSFDSKNPDDTGEWAFTFGPSRFSDEIFLRISMPSGSGAKLTSLVLSDWSV